VRQIPQEASPGSTPRLKKINHYVLRAKLGSGSSSSVYLGIDSRTNESYAIKRIRLRELARTTAGVAQLEREIRLMKLFDHRNILKIGEVLHMPSADEAYLVLEYAEKGCVGNFIERGVRIPDSAILSILKQVLQAVKYLHDSGYVHQDIKPSNILINRDGLVKLADFGIGHSFDSAAMVVGSPAYQAPEALNDAYPSDDDSDSSNEGPQKEDIWALGVTLYQMLFLKLPFVGDNLYELVNFIKEHPLELPDSCPPRFAEVLRRMLSVDPAKRIGVEELLQNQLIAKASDFANDLPDPPVSTLKEGHIVELEAKTCGDGYSFAALPIMVPRRFSYHVRDREPVPTPNFTQICNVKAPIHSDGDDGDSVAKPHVGAGLPDEE
jgi:serine/threonine-protein kinase 11